MTALLEEWDFIPEAVGNNDIPNMKGYCDMCVQAGVHHIPH